jgi:hypothetical protein
MFAVCPPERQWQGVNLRSASGEFASQDRDHGLGRKDARPAWDSVSDY